MNKVKYHILRYLAEQGEHERETIDLLLLKNKIIFLFRINMSKMIQKIP